MLIQIKLIATFFFLFIYLNNATAQQTTLPSAEVVQVNNNLTAHQYEFSALAKWNNKIVLVPQNRKNVIDTIFMIDSAEVDQSIQECLSGSVSNSSPIN